MHHGDTAVGEFGMMPKTIALMKTEDPSLAARRYAQAALRRTRGCPISAAVILWEQGLSAPYRKPKAWGRAHARLRLQRALSVWNAHGYDPALSACFLI